LAQQQTDALKALGHPLISASLETSDLTTFLKPYARPGLRKVFLAGGNLYFFFMTLPFFFVSPL
jgi:hypothetical protein